LNIYLSGLHTHKKEHELAGELMLFAILLRLTAHKFPYVENAP